MNKAWVIALLLAVSVAVGWYLMLESSKSSHYRLLLVNNSDSAIDSVRAFGSGAVTDVVISSLAPGQQTAITIAMKNQGQLRFEVVQGYSRIDAILEQDVSRLSQQWQSLQVNDNHHFILSYQKPALAD